MCLFTTAVTATAFAPSSSAASSSSDDTLLGLVLLPARVFLFDLSIAERAVVIGILQHRQRAQEKKKKENTMVGKLTPKVSHSTERNLT